VTWCGSHSAFAVGCGSLSGMQEQTIETVAEELGVSMSTIRAWADMAGLPMRRGYRGRRLFTPDDVARLGLVARMRESGQDPAIIRAALNVPTVSSGTLETVTTLAPSVDSQSPQWVDRLAGTLEAAIGEGERWGAVLARLHALETDLRAAQDRVAALEAARHQAEARVAALEARRPRFGWLAGSVALFALASALLGRPVPVQAAPSLAEQMSALKKDIYLLKVAANTLSTRDFYASLQHHGTPWTVFPGVGQDRRDVIQLMQSKEEVLRYYAENPSYKPDPLYDSDLCFYCEGVIPDH